MKKTLQEELVKICIDIAKKGKGALIVVGNCEYKPLIKQRIKPFRISDDPKLFKSLAEEDGAMILDYGGIVKAYRVKVLNANKVLKNFGTRHSTGYSVSFNRKTTAYLVSEEDNLIRIFRRGKMIEIDPKKIKDSEEEIPAIGKLLEDVGAGTLSSLGAVIVTVSSSTVVSFTTMPGILLFGGAFGGLYFLIKRYVIPFTKKVGED